LGHARTRLALSGSQQSAAVNRLAVAWASAACPNYHRHPWPRASEQFLPELALVAEDSSGVIAHVMLSWVGVEGGSRTRILNLTPVPVRPDRQRIGVGARLIRDALGRAEEAGEPAVMVEGVRAY
jgi:GNAT superfamily N-acetyltransferase